MPYDNLAEVRSRMEDLAPHLVRFGNLEPANYFAQALELSKVIIPMLLLIIMTLINLYINSINMQIVAPSFI